MKKKTIQEFGRYAVFTACLFALILFYFSGIHNQIENKIFDSFFQLRDSLFDSGAEKIPITIVGIEKQTLNTFKSPMIFWEREFAEIVRIISKTNPRAIGFDILHLAQADLEPFKAERKKLEKILLSTKNIVLPYSFSGQDIDIPIYLTGYFQDTLGLSQDITSAQKAAMLPVAEKVTVAGFGFVDLTEDEDGIIRRIILAENVGRIVLASFPLRLYLAYHGLTIDSVITGRRSIIAGNKIIPLDMGSLIINFTGVPGTIHMLPMSEVIRNKNDISFLRRHLEGRIVLIGAYDLMLNDFHNTPYISSKAGLIRGMFGIEIIANALATMLQERYIYQSGTIVSLIITLFFALRGMLLTRKHLSTGVFAVIAIEVIYIALVFMVFAIGRRQIACILPLLSLPWSFACCYLYEHYILGKDKIFLSNILKSYLDPRIVEKVIRDGDIGLLGGLRREITVLFSDIRNFTALSEKIKNPENVVKILNIYLPEMSQLILEREGCVDKFIGDGIMAFWNAPNDVKDHAVKAVQCAIAMQEKMEKINSILENRKLISSALRIGIGIHTGQAIIGNVGSELKNDYTAIGDTVNLASRLEGKTKDFGYNIIISDSVHKRLRGMHFNTAQIGRVEVKGKRKKTQVYGIIY